jgi:hypothetical protein
MQSTGFQSFLSEVELCIGRLRSLDSLLCMFDSGVCRCWARPNSVIRSTRVAYKKQCRHTHRNAEVVVPRVNEHPVALLREVLVDRDHASGIVGEGEAAGAQQPGANVRYLQRHGVNRPQILEGMSNREQVQTSRIISDPVIE